MEEITIFLVVVGFILLNKFALWLLDYFFIALAAGFFIKERVHLFASPGTEKYWIIILVLLTLGLFYLLQHILSVFLPSLAILQHTIFASFILYFLSDGFRIFNITLFPTFNKLSSWIFYFFLFSLSMYYRFKHFDLDLDDVKDLFLLPFKPFIYILKVVSKK